MVADYVAVNIAIFLFNTFRFYFMGRQTGIDGLCSYLCSQTLVLEQILFPLGMLAIFALSGYYNRPFDKSRLSEFNQTLVSALIGASIIYLLALINDDMGMRRRNYFMIFILVGLIFTFTYAVRLLITSKTISNLKKRDGSIPP